MGTMLGHVLPGTLFLLVGMWRLWCSIIRYVSNPRLFRVEIWNPVPGYRGRLKYLELYAITIGAFVDMCIELLYATHLKLFVKGGLNPVHLNSFEHSGMLLMFFAFGLIALLSETTLYLPLPPGALSLIASAAFTAELLLFFFHSTTHEGLEGYYHVILCVLVGLCILWSIAAALFSTSFPVELCIGIAATLQGLWLIQIGLALYSFMLPNGCKLNKYSIVSCSSKEHEIRGELLANSQLFFLVFVVLASTAGMYVYAETKFRHMNSSYAPPQDD